MSSARGSGSGQYGVAPGSAGVASSRPHRLTAFVLLSALLVRLPVSAQDVAPSAADPEPVAPAHAVEAPIAPPTPAAAVVDPVRPTVPFVAPEATAIAWQELHEIQRREEEIWKQRPPRVALPLVGLGVGLSMFVVMLPLGSIMVLNAREGVEASEAEHLTRVGAPLVFFGVVGLAAFVTSAAALARIRKRHLSREAQIKSLIERRLQLDNLLEGEWRATHAQRAP